MQHSFNRVGLALLVIFIFSVHADLPAADAINPNRPSRPVRPISDDTIIIAAPSNQSNAQPGWAYIYNAGPYTALLPMIKAGLHPPSSFGQ